MKYKLFIICLCFLSKIANAQESIDTSDAIVAIDSLDSNENNDRVGMLSMFSGKPGRAALYSLIIPGGGQLYNKRFWKAPLVIAIEGTVIGFGIYYNNLFNQYDRYFKELAVLPIEEQTVGHSFLKEEVRLRRSIYRKNNEYAWFIFGVVHLVSAIEAFVDRHLMSFDVSDDLSFKVETQYIQESSFQYTNLSFYYSLK